MQHFLYDCNVGIRLWAGTMRDHIISIRYGENPSFFFFYLEVMKSAHLILPRSFVWLRYCFYLMCIGYSVCGCLYPSAVNTISNKHEKNSNTLHQGHEYNGIY
jgi:hypothetical protein